MLSTCSSGRRQIVGQGRQSQPSFQHYVHGLADLTPKPSLLAAAFGACTQQGGSAAQPGAGHRAQNAGGTAAAAGHAGAHHRCIARPLCCSAALTVMFRLGCACMPSAASCRGAGGYIDQGQAAEAVVRACSVHMGAVEMLQSHPQYLWPACRMCGETRCVAAQILNCGCGRLEADTVR